MGKAPSGRLQWQIVLGTRDIAGRCLLFCSKGALPESCCHTLVLLQHASHVNVGSGTWVSFCTDLSDETLDVTREFPGTVLHVR